MSSRSAADRQDGLHNIITTDEFQAALFGAIERHFAPLFEPDLKEALRRYVNKGRRNTPHSVNVHAVANGGPTQLVDIDEERIELWIQNNGIAPVSLGNKQVTVGGANDPNGGIVLAPGNMLIINNNIAEWWAVSATDGQDVRILDVAGGVIKP